MTTTTRLDKSSTRLDQSSCLRYQLKQGRDDNWTLILDWLEFPLIPKQESFQCAYVTNKQQLFSAMMDHSAFHQQHPNETPLEVRLSNQLTASILPPPESDKESTRVFTNLTRLMQFNRTLDDWSRERGGAPLDPKQESAEYLIRRALEAATFVHKIVKQNEDTYATLLDLTNLQLLSLPTCFTDLTHLRIVDLSKNQLSQLPEGFRVLTNLREIRLSENKFTSFPEVLLSLLDLESIDITQNQLCGLPNNIGKLQNLKVLKIHGNPFRSLPQSLSQLPSKFTLDITGHFMSLKAISHLVSVLKEHKLTCGELLVTEQYQRKSIILEDLVDYFKTIAQNQDYSTLNLKKLDGAPPIIASWLQSIKELHDSNIDQNVASQILTILQEATQSGKTKKLVSRYMHFDIASSSPCAFSSIHDLLEIVNDFKKSKTLRDE